MKESQNHRPDPRNLLGHLKYENGKIEVNAQAIRDKLLNSNNVTKDSPGPKISTVDGLEIKKK